MKNKSLIMVIFAQSLIGLSVDVLAESTDQDESSSSINSSSDNTLKREDIYITGGAEEIKKQPGSAHLVNEQELQKFEYTDINRVLSQIPGVNIQEEEGYGLRPNIGLRGAHPHRSRKIALMEDGILIGPAPYSAPAAYYFPMFAKMEGIEVFKGPAAIKHGPNTVGGAVNLVTRSIPDENKGQLNIALGKDNLSKVHSYYGQRGDQWGWMIDGMNLQTDGFKELDTGNNTGFNKNDVTFKGLVNSDVYADIYQQLELKIQYSDEDSNSTYTGLTEDDFDENPYRRYAGSDNDRMETKHTQYMLSHYIELDPTFSLTTKMYRNEFERLWSKLNGFNSATSLTDILANPNVGTNADFMQVLKGETNSVDLGADGTLIIGNNDREYRSQGVQFIARWEPLILGAPHEFEFGVRFHNDQIKRNHSTDKLLMSSGELISDGSATLATTVNKDSTDAIALHVQDKLELGDLTISGGVRAEFIDSKRENRSATSSQDSRENSDSVIIPGGGVFYQLTKEFGLLAGVYKGFSPVGPGQSSDIEAEESLNYEAGFRYYQGAFNTEMIGFYNDYSNIKGVCTFSSGCDDADIDKEFNGGEAEIKGVEMSAGYQFESAGLSFPIKFNYTFTDATFASNFGSSNPDWGIGEIKSADLLPYIPEHQYSFSTGIAAKKWRIDTVLKYVGERNDTANENVNPSNRVINSYAVVDLKGSFNITQDVKVYTSINNIFDKEYVTSLRPYGARPGAPQIAQIGMKVSF
ncbi:MAG: Fe(3+) dicitrate transport protein [Oleiphilaceae bacterium]|jgi:Fe(3+) dicitrate transport protein